MPEAVSRRDPAERTLGSRVGKRESFQRSAASFMLTIVMRTIELEAGWGKGSFRRRFKG
jgi:hypothetical protein